MRKIKRGKPDVQIVNVVASGSLEHGIDIRAVNGIFPETEYNPKKFPGSIDRSICPQFDVSRKVFI